MKEGNGHKLESPNYSESTLKCCDFIWSENAEGDCESHFGPQTCGIKIVMQAISSHYSYYHGEKVELYFSLTSEDR